MRKACVLFYVPDLEDPVGVEGVDAPASLVADHVDDVIMLKRRPRSQID